MALKKFGETPENTSKPNTDTTDLPSFTRDSSFSPFADMREERNKSLGEKIFGSTEPDLVGDEDAIMERMASSEVEKVSKKIIVAVELYQRAMSAPRKTKQAALVKYYRAVKKLQEDHDADLIMMMLITNVAHYMKGYK